MDLASLAHGARRLDARLFDHVARDHCCRWLVGERPAPVLFDANRHRFVSPAIEIRENRCGRGERHFVFTRPSAVEHANTQTLHSARIQYRWPMADGRWPMADRRWPMADGRWPMSDARCPMPDGRRSMSGAGC